MFFKAAEIVLRRRDEIAEILARETGSTVPVSTAQQDCVAAALEQAAKTQSGIDRVTETIAALTILVERVKAGGVPGAKSQ